MRRILFLLVSAIVILILLRLSVFTVDRAEYVYLTRFGRHVKTFDGAQDGEAGLHLKWPWPIESVQRYDQRLQYFDLPGAELLTRDAQGKTIDTTLTVDAYVCWRIADAQHVDRFIRSVGTLEGARAILGQRINSELGAAISGMQLEDLISVKQGEPDASGAERRLVDVKRDYLHKRLLESGQPSLQTAVREEYGIEVIDIRLRRINHAGSVRQAIFDRIISERERKVADYQSEGERQAADIKSTSDRKVTVMKAEADAKAIRLRGEADAEADRIRNEAQAKDPQLYSFLKKLEEYQRILGDNKTMLLLSTHREMFDALFQPPNPVKPEKKEEKKEGKMP
jgi:membrane protease subunit HflC